MNRNRLIKENQNLLALLELDLKGEYEAIEMYDKHIDIIEIKEVKEMLIHIRNEEKEHVDELMELIKKFKK